MYQNNKANHICTHAHTHTHKICRGDQRAQLIEFTIYVLSPPALQLANQ